MGSRRSAVDLLRKELGFVRTMLPRLSRAFQSAESNPNVSLEVLRTGSRMNSSVNTNSMNKVILGRNDISLLHRRHYTSECAVRSWSSSQLMRSHGANRITSHCVRSLSSRASKEPGQASKETKKEISTVESPFDSPTYNIPEKPVTFTEGASYSLIILAGLGVAAFAGYGVFKELIFEPKEYTIFNNALKRIQGDAEVRVRIGHPITGYGQESRNRAARQRIPNRTWTDEDGVYHIEVNFYIRGPHGAGKVFAEMYKDKVERQWKFTYLIVEIKSPTPAQLILESYLPSYAPA